MRSENVFDVTARWDGSVGVWVAESDAVPGLVAEADSPGNLEGKLSLLIPELLELNGAGPCGEPEFRVRYERPAE